MITSLSIFAIAMTLILSYSQEESQEERNNLIDFLTNVLHDANMTRYVPESILSGYCFPNNDVQARADIGCE